MLRLIPFSSCAHSRIPRVVGHFSFWEADEMDVSFRAWPVDERSARVELEAVGYRVLIIHPGASHETFDAVGCSPTELQGWAHAKNPHAEVRIALRVPLDDGLTLVWFPPSPNGTDV